MKTQAQITYKVWLEIERFDEKSDSGATMDAPGSSLATFSTYRKAWEYAESVTRLAQTAPAMLEAAELVASRWDKGDLAEAVRILSDCVQRARAIVSHPAIAPAETAGGNLPMRFDDYEIAPCRRFREDGDRDRFYYEPCTPEEADVWTLYGHIPGQGVEAIGDFESCGLAEHFYARITGKPYG